MSEFLQQERLKADAAAVRPLRLDKKTAGEVRRGFGLDPAQLSLNETDAVRAMGARAVTKGNVISFAPGAFSPDTWEGRATLGHELEHVRSQAKGEVPMTGKLLEQPAYEAAADRAGEAFAAGSLFASGPASVPSGAAAQSAPAQCARGRVRNWLDKHMISDSRKKLENEYNYQPMPLGANLVFGYKFSPFYSGGAIVDKICLAMERKKEKKKLKEEIRSLSIPENPLYEGHLYDSLFSPEQPGMPRGQNTPSFGLDELFPKGGVSDTELAALAENSERLTRDMALQKSRERLAELNRPGKLKRFFKGIGRRIDRSTIKSLPNRPQAPESLGVGPQDPRERNERENRLNYPWLY